MGRWALVLLAGCGRVGFEPFDPRIECPSAYEALETGCYRFAVGVLELAWRDAEQACEADGAHLAVIGTDAERIVLANRMPEVRDFWVGASDLVTPNDFISVTRQPFLFAWGGNEPNDTGDCLELEAGAIGDSNCELTNEYICELDGFLADPTTF